MRGGLVALVCGLAIASIASATPITSVWTGGRPLLLAGAPPDSPANRVDPNVATSPYAGVVSINMRYLDTDGTPRSTLCTGSAISSTWILTAAHCVDPFDTGVVIDLAKPDHDVRIALNDVDPFDRPDDIYVANFVTMHPDYPGFANCPFGNPGCLNDDLALIRLERPLPSTVPVYSFFDQIVPRGTIFHMVGYGDGGNGIDGFTPDAESDFFVKRVGANVFDVFDRDDEQNFASGSAAEVFGFDFDGTKNGQERDQFCEQAIHVCGAKLANDVETLLGPGDSGGPSFIKTLTGELLLVGVNTFGYTFAYRLPNGELDDTPGDFGDSSGGILLYPYLDWIRATAVPEPGSLALVVLAAGLLAASRRRGTRARR